MNVRSVTLPLIEHEGRCWIHLRSGRVIDITGESTVGISPEFHVRLVEAALSQEDWSRGLDLDIARAALPENDPWERFFWHLSAGAHAFCQTSNDLQYEWARRIDALRNRVVKIVKRRSFLGDEPVCKPCRTWEQLFNVALERSIRWEDQPQWEKWFANISNELKRRSQGTRREH